MKRTENDLVFKTSERHLFEISRNIALFLKQKKQYKIFTLDTQ